MFLLILFKSSTLDNNIIKLNDIFRTPQFFYFFIVNCDHKGVIPQYAQPLLLCKQSGGSSPLTFFQVIHWT